MTTWTVPESLQGARVDRAACSLTGLSMAVVRRLCAEGRMRLDGRACSKGDTVRAGQVLAAQVGWLVAPTSSIAVLYVDRRVVIVDKPAGMPCHPLVPGEGGTALDAVAALHPDVATASPDPREGGLLHRLDTGTSGALAFARDDVTWHELRAAFAHEDVDKGYLAVVHGRVARALDVATAIAHDPRDPRRMIIDGQGRGARTAVRPLACHDDVTLVDVTAHGGRRHQVRVHLASVGHPLVGDVLYGAAACDLGHHALHAHRLALPGVPVVHAPVPSWLVELAAARGVSSGLQVPLAVPPA